MAKKIEINATNLVEEFRKEYESKNRQFLLFDLANVNENANTKVLKYLLQYNKGQFLKSFLDRIGLPKPKGFVSITDQEKAIGLKDAGFIDLYIQYDNVHVIDDILPWLEEDVMPNIPYAEDGLMIAGVRQYIAFLKHLLANESSKVVDAFVEWLKGNDVENYHSLMGAINPKFIYPEDVVMKSLRKELGARAEAIFSRDVAGEWALHFTPTFIILYKKSWAALDTRKYSIPSLYLYAGSTEYFLKNNCLNTLKLGVDHLSPSEKVKYPEYNFGNHGKSIGFELLENPGSIKCSDINSQAARKEFYKKIIEAVKPVVDMIDKDVVAASLKKCSSGTPDEILKKVVKSLPALPIQI